MMNIPEGNLKRFLLAMAFDIIAMTLVYMAVMCCYYFLCNR